MGSKSSEPASAPAGESRWSRWGTSAFTKSIKISDWASGYANAASAKIGGERFWPRSDDTEEEILKCERILRVFTVEGIPSKDAQVEEFADGKGNKIKKKRKVLRKIPPRAIKNAKGIVIYTAMRSGIAPFGGAGGTGLVLARLPDGSWSAPASVSPNNVSVGLLLGVDVFDVILLLNTDKALESFYSHKVTLGAETAVAAGPVGAGASMESGLDRAPIYSYVRSRGLYAGIEAMGQAFLSRFDENERFYYWPGIKAEDILKGKVRTPPSVYPLHRALRDAESGVAQGGKLERTVYDVVKIPQSEVMSRLSSTQHSSRRTSGEEGASEEQEEELVRDGEKLKLPPTPAELEALEMAGIPDEEDIRLEQLEKLEVYKLPAPPMHRKIRTFWDQHPNKRAWRPTKQLVKRSGNVPPEMIPLPLSPWEVPLPPSPSLDADKLTLSTSADDAVPLEAILPPPRRNESQNRPDVEIDSVLAHRGDFAPPPRRKDAQGAAHSKETSLSEGFTSTEDYRALSSSLSPPPRRRDGQGALGKGEDDHSAHDTELSLNGDAVPVPATIEDGGPPHVLGALGEGASTTHEDKAILGQDVTEAEADAMIAEAQHAESGGNDTIEEKGATSSAAMHTGVSASPDDAAHTSVEAPSPVVPVTDTHSLPGGILPPPPRRPERKR